MRESRVEVDLHHDAAPEPERQAPEGWPTREQAAS